jgi:hypothetical protein
MTPQIEKWDYFELPHNAGDAANPLTAIDFKITFTPKTRSGQIDIIDTWNMTITSFAENIYGNVKVERPRQKYLAVRIKRTA